MASGKDKDTADWAQAAQQWQQNLVQQWTQMAQALPGAAGATALDPMAGVLLLIIQ